MILTDKELARIPIAPRAERNRAYTKPVTFLVAKDPAVTAIAKMVVAGVDKKHNLHPHYDAIVKDYGKEKAHELIEGVVANAGACDVIRPTCATEASDCSVASRRTDLDSLFTSGRGAK